MIKYIQNRFNITILEVFMDNRFSYYFKELRKSQGLTQEQIAEMLGVSSQAISKWECGTAYPDIEMLPIITNIFKVSTDYLLGVDVTKQEMDIAEIITRSKTLCNNNKDTEAVSLLRNAMIQYPASCDIMYWLAHTAMILLETYRLRKHKSICFLLLRYVGNTILVEVTF